jgi:hypothetical protein
MNRFTWLFIISTLICAFYAAPSRRLPLLLLSPGAITSTASGLVFEGDIVAFECTIGDDKELNSDAFIQSLVKFSGASEYACCMKSCNELKECATRLACSSCTRVLPQTCSLSFVVGLQHDGLSIRCGYFDGARNSSSKIITLKVVPRQLKFSVSVDSPPFSANLLPYDWNGTERVVLEHPPASSRLLRNLSQPGSLTLFVQGDHVPYRLPAETRSDEPPVCPALSTQYLQQSLISPTRHLLLCINQQPTPDPDRITLKLTCEAIVPRSLRSNVRFLWLLNGKVSRYNVNTRTRKIHTFVGHSEQDSWILDIPTRNVVTSIECRVFVNDTVLVPCCNASTNESVCQPVTGFARVVLDVVDATSGSSAAHSCAPGAELDHGLQINDKCPTDATAHYCQIQSLNTVLSSPPSQEVNFPYWKELFIILSISMILIFGLIIYCIKKKCAGRPGDLSSHQPENEHNKVNIPLKNIQSSQHDTDTGGSNDKSINS